MTANDSDRVGKAPHLVSGMHGAPPMAWSEVLSRENDHDLKVLWLYNACVSGAWRSGTFVFLLTGIWLCGGRMLLFSIWASSA